MNDLLKSYAEVAGQDVVNHLLQLAGPLKGMKLVHVNSTKEGGGVAEILRKMVPLMEALGLEVSWEVITGTPDFFQCTKTFHNSLQGNPVHMDEALLNVYEKVNQENAEALRSVLEEADIVFIHDPQPAPLLHFCPNRKGKWIWRCHIDVSKPHRPVWKYLRNWVKDYDASVFSLEEFSQSLPHAQYLIPPSIDPLSEKNMYLPAEEVDGVFERFGLKRDIPLILQVSRFDRFKDPIGVIEAFWEATKFQPIQLVLAGGGATDDPEGEIVLQEVRSAAEKNVDIHVLLLPPDEHRTINALQRAATLIVQKSIKEGFGLTVTEAMWKGKPVIGGDTGGIRLQVINHYTGFLVRSPEGAALRIRYLLYNKNKLKEMGEIAKSFVRENFLITRHVRDYLAMIIGTMHGLEERIDFTGEGIIT
jgi:trehalose synthase